MIATRPSAERSLARSLTRRSTCHRATMLLIIAFALAAPRNQTLAHPLGSFTINHFARVEVSSPQIRIRFVIDMAEIAAFQELQKVDADGDGASSNEELNSYLERSAPQYADNLLLTIDGARVPLEIVAKKIGLPPGAGGLPTLRVECDLAGVLPPASSANAIKRLRFENTNHRERLGWHEIVVAAASGVSIFDSSAFGTALTDELKAYPEEMIAAPLDERVAELSFTSGAVPVEARKLLARDGQPVVTASRDRLAELITVPEVTPSVALLSLLVAAALGAVHAFSPGHGKAVVGAYLVGSRGTPRHALFLGLTVTITHTLGVFALGLVTLFASQYVLPERLFPILSLISGLLVLSIGLSLFVHRLRALLGGAAHDHHHYHMHTADGGNEHFHGEEPSQHHHDEHRQHQHHHSDEHTQQHHDDVPHSHAHSHIHSRGGRVHSHLPPGCDGSPVTWRSLLALSISGGLLPCPSALVVLLSAITLGRVGYGLALVVAFSIGLAATLTAIGLMFVYAKRFIERPMSESRLVVRVLPVASALVIACIGAALCYEALAQAGFGVSAFASEIAAQGAHEISGEGEPALTSLGAFAVLGLGFVFGLKHATEADHVVAVSTIVSEHRNLWRAATVGALWGAGHTASLVIVGVVVLALRVAIPERVGTWLEFGVALMIIGLGVAALLRALRGRADVHIHPHTHDGVPHAHIHFHEQGTEHVGPVAPHSHAISGVGIKPLIVGAVHGLAGSAALTLLVLTQIESVVVGLLYLIVFGIGSIIGMLMMSSLVGLPFALGSRRFAGFSNILQVLAGVLSIAFGIWYTYNTGIASVLLAKVL